MPVVRAVAECAVRESFRVQQVAGMFDMPLAKRMREEFAVEVPELGDAWRVGLIVGPSGSGKSCLAREMFGKDVTRSRRWPKGQAIIDAFEELPIHDATGLLTAVGMGSPPAWVKPYDALSRGEQFRCDLARALMRGEVAPSSERRVVVVDEYTSVVDRTVARVASAALAKSLRSDRLRSQFVAVTCHEDVAEWLEPDWLIDMERREFHWRGLRRWSELVEVRTCGGDVWKEFQRFHYLSGGLNWAARCYVARWNSVDVAFCALIPMVARSGWWRITRLVTRPEYQGIGLGMGLAEAIAKEYVERGERVSMTASHPAVVAHCRRSEMWRKGRVERVGMRKRQRGYQGALGRLVASFEYMGT
jgi:ABC-type lipoprotein export system ATPase subunit